MALEFHDAHCHASDHAFAGNWNVLNGTKPADWPQVVELAKQHAGILPAIGLHPWEVKSAPDDWQAGFARALESGAKAIGEIGLDRWIEDDDNERQEAVFCWQLNQAAERDLPVSIHCLKATDPLLHILKEHPYPKRGIHLHAYSGSAEQVAQFAEFGAYFSFNASQLKGKAKKAPAAVQAVPADRLLIETDAPDTLGDGEAPTTFLRCGYERVAELRAISLEKLTEQVAANFTRYFFDD